MTQAETPRKILDAATAVFAWEGFKGARMQQIARKAGVNQALLHYYFRSKENLYEEVLARFFANIFSQLFHDFQEETDPEAAFTRFIHAYMDLLARNPELPRLMVSEIMEGGAHMMRVADRIFAETGLTPPRLIGPFIEKAVQQNRIRPVDPMQTTISVIGMCIFYFVARPLLVYVWGEPADEKQFLEDRKNAIVDLVLHGIARTDP
ncbi:MAG: TetR/AcrR family transcriptional regulator [Desulfosudaceae bacterium]